MPLAQRESKSLEFLYQSTRKKTFIGGGYEASSRRDREERTLLLLRSEGRLHLGRAKASFASALGLHCLS